MGWALTMRNRAGHNPNRVAISYSLCLWTKPKFMIIHRCAKPNPVILIQ